MEDAKAILREGIERWNAQDRKGFLELYDEKVIFVNESTGEKLVGREEFGKGFYDIQVGAYPDVALKDPILFGEGDSVCFQGLFVGTHTGVFRTPEMEFPPTGKHVETPFVFIAEVENGKVTSARIFYDRLRTLEQEGVVQTEQLARLATV